MSVVRDMVSMVTNWAFSKYDIVTRQTAVFASINIFKYICINIWYKSVNAAFFIKAWKKYHEFMFTLYWLRRINTEIVMWCIWKLHWLFLWSPLVVCTLVCLLPYLCRLRLSPPTAEASESSGPGLLKPWLSNIWAAWPAMFSWLAVCVPCFWWVLQQLRLLKN